MNIEKPVKTRWMMLIGMTGFGWLYVFHRVHRMKLGIALFILFVATPTLLQAMLPYPLGILFSLTGLVAIELLVIRKACNNYNRNLIK